VASDLKIWKICNENPIIGVCCEGKLAMNVEFNMGKE
jgi:hypothetical protein